MNVILVYSSHQNLHAVLVCNSLCPFSFACTFFISFNVLLLSVFPPSNRTWFLFDIVFYGNTIFQPIVVEAAFGGSDGTGNGITLIRKTAIDSLILTSIALPGYAMAGYMMGKQTGCILQTPRYVMLQG